MAQVEEVKGFLLPVKAPAFKHKSLATLTEREPISKPPSMDNARSEHSCSKATALRRQLWGEML